MNQAVILIDRDKVFPMGVTEWITIHNKTNNKKVKKKCIEMVGN